MDEELQIRMIETYLSGEMSSREKELFEKELASDPHLNQLFKEHKYFLDGITGLRTELMSERLRHHSKASESQVWSLMKWKNISVAAIILLLLGMFYFLMPTRLQRLARQYYSAPLAQIQRSNVVAEDTLYEKGMRAYAASDWNSAISNFNQVKAGQTFYQRSIYYTAHSYMALREFEKALELFQSPVISTGQYQQQSEWNRILLKMFLKYPAEEILSDLNMIANDPDHFYRDPSIELMDRIERNRD